LALANRDRVLETSLTVGLGAYVLAGAVAGFQSFAAVGDGNTCSYSAWEVDANGNPSGGWECGLGTYSAGAGTLARTSVYASSNAGAAVNWAAGTRRIAIAPQTNGTLVVRQPGGTPGTHEVQFSHNGAQSIVSLGPDSTQLRFQRISDSAVVAMIAYGVGGQTNSYVAEAFETCGNRGTTVSGDIKIFGAQTEVIQIGNNRQITFSSGSYFGTARDVGIQRSAAGVLKITDASTGGGQLEFPQVADVGTPSTNSARIGAEDVAGTAEMIVADENGTETQISPHAADAPAAMQDGNPANRINDEIHRSFNTYLGRVEFINLTRLARMVEAIAAGNLAAVQALPAAQRQCYFSESLANYNARTGRAKTVRTWQQVQNALQARYDAARTEEVARHDEWLSLPADKRGDEPPVRPIRDIRKPVPAWLAARGVT
jgi:hypothetical protein